MRKRATKSQRNARFNADISPLEAAANALYQDERFDEAVTLYRMAVEQSRDTCGAQTFFYYARTLAIVGEEDRAIEYYQKAAHAAEKHNDVALAAQVYERTANQYWRLGKVTEALEQAAKIRALTLPPESPLKIRGIVREARLLVLVGKVTEALRIIDEVERSKFHADLDDLAVILEVKGYAALHAGDTGTSIDNIRRACELAEKRDDCESTISILNNLACVAHDVGNMADCISAYNRALSVALDHNASWRATFQRLQLAALYAQVGNFRDSYSLFEKIDRTYVKGINAFLFTSLAAYLSHVSQDGFSIEPADQEVLHMAIAGSEPQIIRVVIGRAYPWLEANFPKELHRAIATLISANVPIHAMWQFTLSIARYGDVRLIRQVRERVIKSPLSSPATKANEILLRLAEMAKGGDHVLQEDAMRAIDIFRNLGWKYHEALALEYGGDIRQARRLYYAIGAKHDYQRLGSMRQSTGRLLLTEREQVVKDLLVAGKANWEIAAELNIAQSTVKSHVSNVLRHYNVSRRSELQSSKREPKINPVEDSRSILPSV